MNSDNKDLWTKVFDKTQKYLLGLSTVSGYNLVTEDSRKTGFAGVYYNIEALRCLYSDLVEKGPMDYLCTYKFSQDPLKHFFGLVRAKFGTNNNPTPYQFKSMYRRILLGVTHKLVENSNVTLQDSTEMIAIIPSAENKVKFIYDHYDFDDIDMKSVPNLSRFKEDVVNYIGGYVVKRISSKLSCLMCINSLKSDIENGIIKSRDIGSNMFYPSRFVEKALHVAETILSSELSNNVFFKPYFFDCVNMQICNTFVSFYCDYLKKMDNHCYDLLKKIVSCYCAIRFKSHAREQNDILKKNRLRSKLSKIILFNNQ